MQQRKVATGHTAGTKVVTHSEPTPYCPGYAGRMATKGGDGVRWSVDQKTHRAALKSANGTKGLVKPTVHASTSWDEHDNIIIPGSYGHDWGKGPGGGETQKGKVDGQGHSTPQHHCQHATVASIIQNKAHFGSGRQPPAPHQATKKTWS